MFYLVLIHVFANASGTGMHATDAAITGPFANRAACIAAANATEGEHYDAGCGSFEYAQTQVTTWNCDARTLDTAYGYAIINYTCQE